MVTGIESFKEWFKGNESQYAIIGGTACDILMTEEGLDFRATKDIDLVLIIEAVDAAFGRKFWDYVKQAGYEHCNKSSGMPQFYRFSHPMSNRYPAMIELFTRKLDAIQLPDDAVLTPLPMDEDISSLSAILLDDDYYEFLKQGKVTVDGVTVLDPESIKKLADFKTEAKKGRTVQWWTNIDELAREVSESLHQQMDRKKRPGWIRGDAFDIEASHAEILSLNKKIRELEQENAELKSQIVKRVPELMAAVVLDQQEDEEEDEKGLKTHGKLLIDSSDNAYKIQLYHNDGECYKNKYEPLDLSCVESHLKKYVKEKDLQAYNAALPSEEEINDYAHKMSVYKTITNGGVALKLRVLNKGTAKATDIRISIVFPKDIFVYDIDDIEKMKEPKAPKLPPNPIEKAEERFMSDLNPVYGLLKNSMDGMQPFYSARSLPIIDPAIFNNSNSSVFESISIRDNSIFAECNQLPHKDDTEFDGIYIVPARKGKFKVSVSLMCSEYIEPKVHDIEFEIV